MRCFNLEEERESLYLSAHMRAAAAATAQQKNTDTYLNNLMCVCSSAKGFSLLARSLYPSLAFNLDWNKIQHRSLFAGRIMTP